MTELLFYSYLNLIRSNCRGAGTFKFVLGIMYLAGLIGHQGMVPGYQCSMFCFPQEDAKIVVLANKSGSNAPTRQLRMQIARILFPTKSPVNNRTLQLRRAN